MLGRAGIWNNGTGARSRVHYGNAYNNAFWDGTQMTYGDGAGNAKPLTSIDVAAHEMSHGVTENTAGLVYSGDSGGLNEATSDIFGAAVEFYANSAADPGDYLIGEKININGNGTPLRYMDRPSKDGRSQDCWTTGTKNLDPHYSSGPLNHWFFLASEGSGAKTINGVSDNSPTCNGTTVTCSATPASSRATPCGPAPPARSPTTPVAPRAPARGRRGSADTARPAPRRSTRASPSRPA